MKTYVLTVSRTFPAKHKRKGEPTYFVEKIGKGLGLNEVQVREEFGQDILPKLHTIRENYAEWKKRFEKIDAGEACLSIRYHTLGRYVKGNRQVEIARLTKEDGIGLQIVDLRNEAGVEYLASIRDGFKSDDRIVSVKKHTIAHNDGLSYNDFKEWFKGYDLSKPMALIQFTEFRY